MLRQRLITAAVIVPILLLTLLWLPPIATICLVAALVLVGAWEWSAFPGFKRSYWRVLYVALIAALMVASWLITNSRADLESLLLVAAAWWVIALAWIVFFPARVNSTMATVAGVVVLVPGWIALARLTAARVGQGEPEADAADGPQLVLFLLCLIAAADVGAYFAGRRFGRIKLAPKVSPGKTWEGVFGGMVLSAAVALAGSAWFEVERMAFVALCGAVVLASIVGDLTESLFKRFAGLKDSGSIFPGHGGVLDRIDSLTAAAPFFVLGLGWLGVL